MSHPLPESTAHTAMDLDNTYKYTVQGLGTRSVTLFPTHARVVREIKNIPITAGTSQVTIIGLSSTLDVDSLKVEAPNGAMITILKTERLPRGDLFNDIDAEISDYSDLDMTKEDDDTAENYPPELKNVAHKIHKKERKKRFAEAAKQVAMNRRKTVEDFGARIAAGNQGYPTASFENNMKVYRSGWKKASRDYIEKIDRENDLTAEILLLQKAHDSLRKRFQRDCAKARAAREKEKKKEHLKRLARKREKERVRREQELRRPREVYAITFRIDAGAEFEAGQGTYDLMLNYATAGASWSPVYDMALSTATNSGILYFDAILRNQTSETWDNCSFVLSTLEANVASRNDSVPELKPWKVSVPSEKGVRSFRRMMVSEDDELFNRARADNSDLSMTTRRVPRLGADKENTDPKGDDDGLETSSRVSIDDGGSDCGRIPSDEQIIFFEEDPDADDDTRAVLERSSLEELELAITYDLVGLDSLPPSIETSRHRVARITDLDVAFSRTVVPKRNRAAILESKIRNGSKLPLIKGKCGLTLDGKFVDRLELSRWAPGSVKYHCLGVEPSIRVTDSGPVAEPDLSEWNCSEGRRLREAAAGYGDRSDTCQRKWETRNYARDTGWFEGQRP
ncbi:hypothetical protein O1611_g7666 [Lasiodiplodia mahajangana]|uniref:Uncharacterized protein n=1 Tax=Lasiodiplodia mahajangana TaxID=1108764 RepID=A0ACC2JEZ0_9PEZI|nr:hypothetical protein O1611_g7666 [Lasiodiplodia mahajangana]